MMIPINPIPMGLISLALIFYSSNLLVFAQNRSTMKPGDVLRFHDNLTSPDGNFVFGFFQFSGNAYLGINATVDPILLVPKTVWVANRDPPLSSANVSLSMDADGVLTIVPEGETPIPLNPSQASRNSSATLMNSGNLVISELNPDGTEKQILWQSFDYPTDTLFPGMKVGVNFKTGQKWSLSSWLSEEVPATGGLSFEWNNTALNGAGELVVKRFGQVYWTSGAITENVIANADLPLTDSFGQDYFVGDINQSQITNGYLNTNLTSLYNFSVVSDSDESYFTYSVAKNQTALWVLTYDGLLSYHRATRVFLGVCDGDSPSPGCMSPEPRSCRSGGQSFELRSGQFNRSPWEIHNISLGISDCWDLCWGNCSCLGYSTFNANGTGCRIWSVADNNFFTQDNSGKQKAIYVLKTVTAKGINKWWIWIVVSVAAALISLLVIVLLYLRKRKRRRDEEIQEENLFLELATMTDAEDHGHDREKGTGGGDLRIFTFATIKEATNDFAAANKLGQGGFGPVYKGTLPEGQEIAVKRLSRSSGQGLVEFRNELVLIAKLQHMNLVRLLGCCVKNDEKMLVYEYMPNKSLDFYLFDERRRGDLNWKCRFGIIEGIAQGILYLHKYSRLRIIHRDLKASNILLDVHMQPKISDFGMARIFGRDVSEANTMRVVGTYGYMSPEYAMEGNFSEKSDVYSFGVLLLEIVSGRKNSSFIFDDRTVNLLGYAWELWTQGRSLELKDPILPAEFESIPQIQRCIHVGLLCIQEHASNRPSMSEVVSFLSNKTMVLPTPNQVAFSNTSSTVRKLEHSNTSERRDHRTSTNVSITAVEPR